MKEDIDIEDKVIVVKEIVKIADGVHDGKITNIVYTNRESYDYLDIYVETTDINGNAVEIKTGVPLNISELSMLGKLLKESGFKFNSGQEIKLSQIAKQFHGRKISFQTTTEKTEKGEFARIINDTIRFT